MKHRLCVGEHVTSTGDTPGTEFNLPDDQAHYLARVLRLKAGARLNVFDGCGREWLAEVDRIERKRVSLILHNLVRDEPPPTPLVLVQSWLKGSAMDAVVQKSVELGATAIRLLDADRSNVKTDERRRQNRLAHLERVIQSAAEQCETLWLPTLTVAQSLAEILESPRPGRTLFLDPGGRSISSGGPEPLTLLIGPEGGWSDPERARAQADDSVETVGLGPLTLRAETAPLAVLSAVRQLWNWSR